MITTLWNAKYGLSLDVCVSRVIARQMILLVRLNDNNRNYALTSENRMQNECARLVLLCKYLLPPCDFNYLERNAIPHLCVLIDCTYKSVAHFFAIRNIKLDLLNWSLSLWTIFSLLVRFGMGWLNTQNCIIELKSEFR